MTKRASAFDNLWDWTGEAKKVFRSHDYRNTRKLHIQLLDIDPEGKLDREIEDILEELDIMLRISNIHRDVVKNFTENAEHILDPDGICRQKLGRISASASPAGESPEKEKYLNYQSFKLRADECQGRINKHIKDLEGLRTSAKNTTEDVMMTLHSICVTSHKLIMFQVLHLLTMKQQQASVVQAWQAVKQSDETIKQ